MKLSVFPIVASLIMAIPGYYAPQSKVQDGTGAALLQQLITVINTRDAEKMRTFFTTSATSDVPVDQRVQRMMDLADQGAPFRIDGTSEATPGLVKAVIVDKNAIRLNVILTTTGGAEPKMKALRAGMVRPVRVPNRKLEGWRDIHNLATLLVACDNVPAMGIATIQAGKLDVAVAGVRAVGRAGLVAADEPWSIGSIGKPICSTVIGRLIEMGKLRWNETLAQALKGVPMQPGYRAVTLEQVMEHRGGIPQDPGFRMDQIHQIIGGAKDPYSIRERYMHNILTRAPVGKPGERFAYSNAGYALLGHIAERVTGIPYERLVHRLVFVPLGLKHSYTGLDRLPNDRPSGHVTGPKGLSPQNMTGPLEFMLAPAGGGMFMSVGDLAAFGATHLAGLRGKNGLLKAATEERLHRGIATGEGNFQYACGWGLESNPGLETFHGHNGSNGTFRSQLAIFPKANLVVAAVVNCGGETEPTPGLEAALLIAQRYSRSAGN